MIGSQRYECWLHIVGAISTIFVLSGLLIVSTEANESLDNNLSKISNYIDVIYHHKKFITKLNDCYKNNNNVGFENLTDTIVSLVRYGNNLYKFFPNEQFERNVFIFINLLPKIQCLLETAIQTADPSCQENDDLIARIVIKELQQLGHINAAAVETFPISQLTKILCKIWMKEDNKLTHYLNRIIVLSDNNLNEKIFYSKRFDQIYEDSV